MKRLAIVAALAATAIPAQASPEPSLLTVRSNGQFGPLALYNLETVRLELRLPSGVQSANGRSFVAARASGARTSLTRYALPSGRVAARGSIAGRYRLAALSARGDRAVLTRFEPGVTELVVVGTSRWTVFRRVELDGSFGVEALSLDGRRVFLIRYDDGGYNLRLYDLRTSRLSFTPLVEGAAGQEKMIGAAWTSVATRDGRWLLTRSTSSAASATASTFRRASSTRKRSVRRRSHSRPTSEGCTSPARLQAACWCSISPGRALPRS
jgi:hypothetical protein